MSELQQPQVIPCDGGFEGCTNTASMIGSKGYAYCSVCGPIRRVHRREKVRKLRPAELRKLQAGESLKRY